LDQEKLPRKRRKKLSQGKKGRNLQESNRGGSLSRMDRSNICVQVSSVTEGGSSSKLVIVIMTVMIKSVHDFLGVGLLTVRFTS